MTSNGLWEERGTGRNAELSFEDAQKLSLQGWEAGETFEVIWECPASPWQVISFYLALLVHRNF